MTNANDIATARDALVDACVKDCMVRISAATTIAIKLLERKLKKIRTSTVLAGDDDAAIGQAIDERADRQPEILSGVRLAQQLVGEMVLIDSVVDARIGHTAEGFPCECPFDREQLEFDVKQRVLGIFAAI